eukprot:4380076-Pyramimonas_sp.AAC.1
MLLLPGGAAPVRAAHVHFAGPGTGADREASVGGGERRAPTVGGPPGGGRKGRGGLPALPGGTLKGARLKT